MQFLPFRTSVFYPVTLTMEPELLIFGAHTLKDRWQRYLQSFSDMAGKWVEPTVLPNNLLVRAIAALEPGQALMQNEFILAIHPKGTDQKPRPTDSAERWLNGMTRVDFGEEMDHLVSLQDMIQRNAAQIIKDYTYDLPREPDTKDIPINRARIRPAAAPKGIIIDDEQGPVLVGKGVKLLPGARIMGPVAIFSDAVVKMGAEIYPGTSIGNQAVVNGEIKNAILHSFSSKGHAGYLGDSIVGRWNNFGSGTTVSNVANTYSDVRYQDWNSNEEVTLSTLKRGVVTGDFVKLGIMTKVFRGTAIGSFSSISTSEPVQGNVPACTWWSGEQIQRYEHELLRTHCSRQMGQRDQAWDAYWEEQLQHLLTSTGQHDNASGE